MLKQARLLNLPIGEVISEVSMAAQFKSRLAASIFALILIETTASSAHAQADLKPLPVASSIDSNGVDIVNWAYLYDVAPISIGPSDQDPIKVSIFLPTERDSFSSDLRIQDPSWVTSTRVSASIGPKSWTFIGGSGASDPGSSVMISYGGGSNAAEVYARDGSTIAFDTTPSWFHQGTAGPINLCAAKITKMNGETLTYYNDNTGYACRTLSIVSNRGYQIKYEYRQDVFDPRRSKIILINNAYEYCDPTAAVCSLSMSWPYIEISPPGATRTYTTSNDKTWSLSGVSQSASLKSPGQSTPGISWTAETYYPVNGYVGQLDFRVTSIIRDGQTWNYTYPSSDPVLGGGSGELIRVQDPLGNVRRYRRQWAVSDGDPTIGEYESPNLITKSINELNQLTNYSYNNQHLPSEVLPPEGNKHLATYDWAGNLLTHTLKAKPGSGVSDATTTYTYNVLYGSNECCDRPVSVTDAKGNGTEYTYDPVHKGVLTETGPAPSAGAPRPVKRYAYVQRYAWVKNSSGAYIQAPTPIWLRDSEKMCRTSATVGDICAAGASDEVTITYDYGPNSGPNNLWLRGKVETADGSSLRTCYSYDPFGNKISETSPRAGLTSCP